MTGVNKTLYIPLYGKAYVSRKGIILSDTKAEQLWSAAGGDIRLKGKSRTKWLAYYMGMRSAVFDSWLREQMKAHPQATVIHIGCGLDSRVLRVGTDGHRWYDVDFPDVIAERRRWYEESDEYRMIPSDVRESEWLAQLPEGGSAIVVMESVSMYLRPEELGALLALLTAHFSQVSLLTDCYTTLAARASKYKNPINDVGVTTVYGLDDPAQLEQNTGLHFVKEHEMTPPELIGQLKGAERAIFKKLYAGGIAKKMYRLYEYESRIN